MNKNTVNTLQSTFSATPGARAHSLHSNKSVFGIIMVKERGYQHPIGIPLVLENNTYKFYSFIDYLLLSAEAQSQAEYTAQASHSQDLQHHIIGLPLVQEHNTYRLATQRA